MLTIHLLSGFVFTSFPDENDRLKETVPKKENSVETSVKKVLADVKVRCKIISTHLLCVG